MTILKGCLAVILVWSGLCSGAMGATRTGGNVVGRSAVVNVPAATSDGTATRSATTPTTTARAATAGRTTVSRAPVSTSSTSASTVTRSAVTARAGTTQAVINTGTKIAGATSNSLINQQCQQKYYGCMDSLCMLDNTNGGRCVCSDRNATFDSILSEIEKLDEQSYQMATVGVDSLENNYDINAVYERPISTKSVDLSLWNTETDVKSSAIPLSGLTGNALFAAAHNMCAASMPECAGSMQYLQLAYSRQIDSDCSAYQNSLEQRRIESFQKLETAKMALVDASYTSLSNANKYDLGQCVVEFKNCMISTGGCGEDFSGCASVAAFDATNTRGDRESSTYDIQGAMTTIQIKASTYDILVSKRPLCESVTKQCSSANSANGGDQVWLSFLREVAPQVKSAELIAEDNVRQNCISNISSCFQQACRDNIDPNNPDGSYDMCLTRPETMLSLCTVPLNACGISTSSATEAAESPIWDFVLARLAAMRVNACTNDFKECLQAEDMCGPDYTQCVGLDTDTIMRMCPYDTLVGCQQVYGDTEIRGSAVYDELYNVAQGIFLNIDNEMYEYCQSALDAAVISACGDTETCNKFVNDEIIGTRSLEYKICDYAVSEDMSQIAYGNCRTNVSQISDAELGRVVGSTVNALGPVTPLAGVIEGDIYWDSVKIDENGNISTPQQYFQNLELGTQISDHEIQVVQNELGQLQNNLDNIYNIIESDPTVQFCMSGRRVDGIKPYSGTSVPRFPQLTKSVRQHIAHIALNKARKNYYELYDDLLAQQSKDYATIAERMAEIQGENGKDARREIARQACVDMAQFSGIAKSKTPKGLAGIITGAVIIAAVAVVTAGAALIAGALAAAIIGVVGGICVATPAALMVVIGSAASDWSEVSSVNMANLVLTGEYEVSNWNYREKITTNFDWENLICHKCITSYECLETREPFFGNLYCNKWADPVEVCTDTQF